MWFLIVFLLTISPAGIPQRGTAIYPFGADDKACSVEGARLLKIPGTVIAECVQGIVQANQLSQDWLSGRIAWPLTPP